MEDLLRVAGESVSGLVQNISDTVSGADKQRRQRTQQNKARQNEQRLQRISKEQQEIKRINAHMKKFREGAGDGEGDGDGRWK